MKKLTGLIFLFLTYNAEGSYEETETFVKETFDTLYQILISSIKNDELVLGAFQHLLSKEMKQLYRILTDSVEFKMLDEYLNSIGIPFKKRIIEIVNKLGHIPVITTTPKASFKGLISEVFKAIPPERLKRALEFSFKVNKTALICSSIDVQNVFILIRWLQSLPVYWAVVYEVKKIDINVHHIVEAVVAAAAKECKGHHK